MNFYIPSLKPLLKGHFDYFCNCEYNSFFSNLTKNEQKSKVVNISISLQTPVSRYWKYWRDYKQMKFIEVVKSKKAN